MSALIDRLTINYEPPGPVARAFLESNAFVRGIRGPFGSGKSTVCCVDILDHALRQRHCTDGKRRSRWAIVRNTYPELKTTTIKTWHEIVSPQIGRWVDQGPPTHTFSADDLDVEVMFLALDSPADVKKLLSMDLTGAWINEARETPKGILDGLTARVGRYPSKSMGGPSWFGVAMDTNPPDSDHWWYKAAETDKPVGFEFFSQPSGMSAMAENAGNLPPRYYERMCSGKTDEWIKVYVHGEYGFITDGRPVFPEYRDGLHSRAFELVRGIPLYVGIDFGLTPAAVIGQKMPMGQWRWRYELTTEHMGAKRFGIALKQFLAEHCEDFPMGAITGDPAGNAESQTDEVTPFQILRSKDVGISAQPAHTNDFTVRREAVAAAMGRIIDGEPGFIVHPECGNLRRGLAGKYQFKRIQMAGDDRFQDKPDKNSYSHVCEALQYAMMGGGEGRALLRRAAPKGGMPRYAQG